MSLISGYICFVYTVHIQLCKQSCFFPFNWLLFTSWLLYKLFHCMLPDFPLISHTRPNMKTAYHILPAHSPTDPNVYVTRFLHSFFHELNPSGFLINSLKWFHWKICFGEDIRKKRDFAHYTEQSRTPRSITLRGVGKLKCPKIHNWQTLRGVVLCTVLYCRESNSAKC